MKTKNKLLLILLTTLMLSPDMAWCQVTLGSNTESGTAPTPNEYVGSSNAYDVLFKTNANTKMTLLNTNGFLGIGLSPSYMLDVNGDVNTASTKIYKIGGVNELWTYGQTRCIYLGGASSTTSTGADNIFVGSGAGANNATGKRNIFMGTNVANGESNAGFDENVFIGYQSGYNGGGTVQLSTFVGAYTGMNASLNASLNTFIGSYAGTANTSGDNNTFVGHDAGYSNSSADNNVFLGYQSGYLTNTGDENTYLGWYAGGSGTNGSDNVCVGYESGHYNSVSANSFLGYESGYGNTTGTPNTLVGNSAGYFNSTGSYNTITGYQAGYGASGGNNSYNSFFGYKAGFAITSGASNVMIGDNSGVANTTGASNIFIGSDAGLTNSNQSGNTYVGYHAGRLNNTSNNTYVGEYAGANCTTSPGTFIGYAAGYLGTTDANNTFVGHQAGYNITFGDQNTTLGHQAGKSLTTGNNNVACGLNAGYTITTGDSNTFVGTYADANGAAYHNCAAFGYGASATASRKMYFGNANVLGLYTTVGLFATSDGRFKTNVTENVKGLEFIKKLRPVTYNLDTKLLDAFVHESKDSAGNVIPQTGDFTASTNIIHSGFIAQEVETAANQVGFHSTIVSAPQNSKDPYGLNYAEIVVPLVKAVQEQQALIDSLFAIINGTGSGERHGQGGQGGNADSTTNSNYRVTLSNSGDPVLYQNEPNPFSEQTTIRFFIPSNSQKATIVFYDQFGKEINKVEISERGTGSIDVNASNLTSGVYSYSLIVDGNVKDTKKMMKGR